MNSILIVDDDLVFLKILEKYLIKNGYDVQCQSSVESALKSIEKKAYDLFLLDYKLADGTGLDIISKTKELGLKSTFIIMTRFDDVRLAVKAMKNGAVDYITKPINQDELLVVIEHVFNKVKTEENNPKISSRNPTTTEEERDFLIGESQQAKEVANQITLIAPTEMSVIIEGESGTGKEHIAHRIHDLSYRKNKPFVAIDCGTLTKELAGSELFGHLKGAFTGALEDKQGRLEVANGGTVFLDEIGNLPMDVQIKLLRVLQERVIQPIGSNKDIEIDVRIVVATNENLRSNTLDGTFRKDLYFRLNEFKIVIPALRQRGDDLLLFVNHFIKKANKELNKDVKYFSEDILKAFKNYTWPGNIRELKNVVKRIVLLAHNEEADVNLLPFDLLHAPLIENIESEETDLKIIQENKERELIIKALKKTKYNKSKAAVLLNIDRSTLYSKLKKYGI